MIGKVRDGMLSLKGNMDYFGFRIADFGSRRANNKVAFRFSAIATIFLIVCVWPLDAQTSQQQYQQAIDALYNLDFSIGQAAFESLTQKEPDNPDFWNGLGSSLWLKILYDQQKLDMENYSGSQFGTKDARETINPADEKRLRDTIQIAIGKANALLRRNPDDVHALYALGVANATLGSFEATARRAYVAAHSKAKTARDYHQKVLKLDPNYNDARLSVGVYDYVISQIPGVLRIILFPFGVSTNGKEAGIQNLEVAALKGNHASIDAKMLLVVVYNREKKYDQALRLISELHARYPRNFLFELSEGSINGKMKNWDAAVQIYQGVLSKILLKQDGYDRLRSTPVLLQLAKGNVERSHSDAAVESFGKVVAARDATDNEKADAHIWMGKIFDSGGRRDQALAQYDAVLKLICDSGYKDEAQKLKRRPLKE
jgi:tetratricopeptide (TPR) repeat protein